MITKPLAADFARHLQANADPHAVQAWVSVAASGQFDRLRDFAKYRPARLWLHAMNSPAPDAAVVPIIVDDAP